MAIMLAAFIYFNMPSINTHTHTDTHTYTYTHPISINCHLHKINIKTASSSGHREKLCPGEILIKNLLATMAKKWLKNMQNLPMLLWKVGKVKVTKFENENCCTGGKTGNCNKFQAKKKIQKKKY